MNIEDQGVFKVTVAPVFHLTISGSNMYCNNLSLLIYWLNFTGRTGIFVKKTPCITEIKSELTSMFLMTDHFSISLNINRLYKIRFGLNRNS